MKKVMEVNYSYYMKLICYKDDTKLNKYRLYRKSRGKEPYEVMAADTLGSVMSYLGSWYDFRK